MDLQKKIKTSLYISHEDQIMLDEIYIKRRKQGQRIDRSAIICEAIRLLHAKEVLGIYEEPCKVCRN